MLNHVDHFAGGAVLMADADLGKVCKCFVPPPMQNHKSVQPWMWVQADIVKQIWKELPKHMDTPVAPLDEEMLVDLAKEPAVIEGHLTACTWG